MPGLVHTFARTWHKLEKQRGIWGMTWKYRVRGVVLALVVLAAMSLASGASWTDALSSYAGWGW